MLRVGVISYLPDTEVRSRRKSIIHASIRDLKSVIPEGVVIDIIAQNYRDGDELEMDGLNYIHHQEGIGQCAARNELLSRFYASDDDFMLYCDDDMAFYDRYNASALFKALHVAPTWFSTIDCFTGLEGRFTPFTAENEKLGLEDKWVFKPMQFSTSGEFRVLRNLNKYYGKEFFYDSGLKYGEDLHFRLKYLSQINSFVCRNVITRSRGLVDNICTLDIMTKPEQEAFYTEVTKSIYDQLGVPLRPNGQYDLSSFRCKIPYLAVSMIGGDHSTTPKSQRTVSLF